MVIYDRSLADVKCPTDLVGVPGGRDACRYGLAFDQWPWIDNGWLTWSARNDGSVSLPAGTSIGEWEMWDAADITRTVIPRETVPATESIEPGEVGWAQVWVQMAPEPGFSGQGKLVVQVGTDIADVEYDWTALSADASASTVPAAGSERGRWTPRIAGAVEPVERYTSSAARGRNRRVRRPRPTGTVESHVGTICHRLRRGRVDGVGTEDTAPIGRRPTDRGRSRTAPTRSADRWPPRSRPRRRCW